MNEIKLSKLITGILVVVIVIVGFTGLLNIDFTTETFRKTPVEIQQQCINKTYLINIEDINLNEVNNQYVFVDLRSQSDFDNGHINNAIHIFASQILEKEPLQLLRKIEKDGKTIVLYSSSPLETNSSWYLLTKLGFENIKILNAKTALVHHVFEITPFVAEILPIDIAGYIKQTNEAKMETTKIEPIKTPIKKVTPVKKEKVEVEEGGC